MPRAFLHVVPVKVDGRVVNSKGFALIRDDEPTIEWQEPEAGEPDAAEEPDKSRGFG
jgi:hypothetical protein